MALNTKLSGISRSALTKIAHFSSAIGVQHVASATIEYFAYPADNTATTDEAKWAIKKQELVTNGDGSESYVFTWAGGDTEKNKVFSTGGDYAYDGSYTFAFVNEK